jgi:hypothetical protein
MAVKKKAAKKATAKKAKAARYDVSIHAPGALLASASRKRPLKTSEATPAKAIATAKRAVVSSVPGTRVFVHETRRGNVTTAIYAAERTNERNRRHPMAVRTYADPLALEQDHALTPAIGTPPGTVRGKAPRARYPEPRIRNVVAVSYADTPVAPPPQRVTKRDLEPDNKSLTPTKETKTKAPAKAPAKAAKKKARR